MLKHLALMIILPATLAIAGYFIGGEVAASIMVLPGILIAWQATEADRMKAEIHALKVRMLNVELAKPSTVWATGSSAESEHTQANVAARASVRN